MEYGTMRCYRCNAPMAAGGYIHCSTCRTEDAISRQTLDLRQTQAQDELIQLARMLARQSQYNRVVDKFEQEEQRNYSLSRLKSPPMTEEEKAKSTLESQKRLERYRKEAQRDKILIYALVFSALAFFGFLTYGAYRVFVFLLSL